MKQIDRIKALTEMLHENIELLESYPDRVKEWEARRDEYNKKTGENYYFYEDYPIQGTSETHIRDIARLLRKELLKI